MAGKGTKPKRNGTLANLYLKLYNLVLTFGWSYVVYKFVVNDHFSSVEGNLWHNVKWPLILSQNAAILEVIHAATGLVPSNPIVTTLQVSSRLFIVDAVLCAVPESYSASSIGLPLCLTAWGITEIIRYSYYFLNLIGFVPYFLLWCRYSFFMVLYPLGISGELLCAYSATQYALANPGALSYTLPNDWNFTFSYSYIMIFTMLIYLPTSPHLYGHMLTQRRKMLQIDSDSAKKVH